MAEENEKKDSSAVGRINSLAGKGRNLQRAYGAYKKARVAWVAGEGLGALAGAVPVAVAVILLIVVIIIFSGAAPSPTVGGEPTNLSPVPSEIPGSSPLTCSTGNYSDCLSSQFNVTVTGTTDQATLKLIYDALSIPMAYPLFSQRFKAARVAISINSAQTGFNGGWLVTNNAGDITIYQKYFEASDRTKKEYLIHETGHSIGNTNDQLQQNFYESVYKAGLDSECYLQGVIKTYALGLINSNTRLPNEAFAEALADSVLCNNTGICQKNSPSGFDIPNFPSTCRSTYEWIKGNVLGG